MDTLVVESLRKFYGAQEILKGISFAVEAGECFGLLGPNGAGKTTTLRCCLGLTAIDGGAIHLSGLPVPGSAREARTRTGVVPQFDNLDVHFTVAENLLIYGRYFGISRRQCEQAAAKLLDFVGLADKADARIDSLSGGMKRRLTIARALINDPQILFMDEPTTALDPQARHLVWDRMKRLLTQGRTIVLTTHFMDEVQRLCDRVAIIDHGALIALDSPAVLIQREVEPMVVEVHGEALRRWIDGEGRQHCDRIEFAGDTAFCYCHDSEPLMKALSSEPSLRALRRAANLEDVFLKLTGRDLRD